MDKHPMKWYKFIIYIQLFLSAALSAVTAIAHFIGGYYGGLADQVYASYRGLKPFEMCIGAIYLALAVFAIIVRQALAHFKEKAPMKYLIFLGFTAASQIIFFIGASILVNASAATSSVTVTVKPSLIMSAIVNVVMILINKIYFDKRAELFVN